MTSQNPFSKIVCILLALLMLGACSTPPKEVSQEMVPLDTSWVEATFPQGYNHSYTFRHPGNQTYTVGMDTDTFSGGLVEKDGTKVVEILDMTLIGCKTDPANCDLDRAEKITADELYAQHNQQMAQDPELKQFLDFPMPSNNLTQITAYEGVENGKNIQLYIVNVGKGVLRVTFFAPEKLPAGYIGDVLASIKPSK